MTASESIPVTAFPPGTRVRVRPGGSWPVEECTAVVVAVDTPFDRLVHLDDGSGPPWHCVIESQCEVIGEGGA